MRRGGILWPSLANWSVGCLENQRRWSRRRWILSPCLDRGCDVALGDVWCSLGRPVRGSWRLVRRCLGSLLERRRSVYRTHGTSWRLLGAHAWMMGWNCRHGYASGAPLGSVLLSPGTVRRVVWSPLGALLGFEGGLPRILRDVLEPTSGPAGPSGASRSPRKQQ